MLSTNVKKAIGVQTSEDRDEYYVKEIRNGVFEASWVCVPLEGSELEKLVGERTGIIQEVEYDTINEVCNKSKFRLYDTKEDIELVPSDEDVELIKINIDFYIKEIMGK